MNDNDRTLIIDLVDGRLSPERERAALARISADPELRAAYAYQLAVADRLRSTPLPSMTASERAHLHATLKAQLHLDDAPPAPARAASRRNRWLAPLGGLAVAAVIIGAVVVLPGTFQSDSSLDVASAPTTTSAAAATSTATIETPAPAAAATPAETAAPGNDASEATPDDESLVEGVVPAIPFVPDVSLDDLATSLSASPDLLATDLNRAPVTDAPDIPFDRVLSCVDTVAAANTGSVVAPLAVTTYDDTEVVIVTVTSEAGEPHLEAYSITSCEKLGDTSE